MMAKRKRRAAPRWSDWIRSKWGKAGGCTSVAEARAFVAEREAAGRSVAEIWRAARRLGREDWTERVLEEIHGGAEPAGLLDALRDAAAYDGWSPAFARAMKAEAKALRRAVADRDDARRHDPVLVRVGRRVRVRLRKSHMER